MESPSSLHLLYTPTLTACTCARQGSLSKICHKPPVVTRVPKTQPEQIPPSRRHPHVPRGSNFVLTPLLHLDLDSPPSYIIRFSHIIPFNIHIHIPTLHFD